MNVAVPATLDLGVVAVLRARALGCWSSSWCLLEGEAVKLRVDLESWQGAVTGVSVGALQATREQIEQLVRYIRRDGRG